MPSTIEALGVLLFAAMPGALCIWFFERVAGGWAIGLSERIYRFIGISLLFHAVASLATYNLWFDYFRSGAVGPDERLPWWLYPVLLGYAIVPALTGAAFGCGYKKGKGWATAVVGKRTAPTAWDAVFSTGPKGWVVMKLKSGDWIGGRYGGNSHVGGYPEPSDLFLELELEVDQDTADFVRDASGDPVPVGDRNWGVLIRWEEVEYLEVTPTE